MVDDIQNTLAPAQPTSRLQALRSLQQQLPVGNQQVAAGYQAARDIQLQNAVSAQPTGGNITAAASGLGAQSAAQAGQQNLALAEQSQRQAGQLGDLALGEQKMGARQQEAGQQMALEGQKADASSRLGQLSEQVKTEAVDNRMRFAKDEANRTLFNERQLADYARVKGATQQQMANYEQQAKQLNDMKIQAMKSAYEKISSALENENTLRQQGLDQKQVQELYELKKATALSIQKQENDQKNRTGIYSTVTGIVGAGVGGFFGGPAGAMAGYEGGSALGGMAGSQTADNSFYDTAAAGVQK